MAVTLARQAIFADHASMTLFTQPYHDALAQLTTMGAPFEITSVDSPSGPVLAFANAASDLRSFMAGGSRPWGQAATAVSGKYMDF